MKIWSCFNTCQVTSKRPRHHQREKTNDQAAEGKLRATRRKVKQVKRLWQQDNGTETGSRSSRSTLKKAKAPSVATSAKTLVPLHEELKNLEIPKEKHDKVMTLFYQHASAATSTQVNNTKSFESKIIKIVRPKSRKKSPSEEPPELL